VFERATHFAIHCRLAGGTSVTWCLLGCLLDTVVSRSINYVFFILPPSHSIRAAKNV
jgi:hypothetical protein